MTTLCSYLQAATVTLPASIGTNNFKSVFEQAVRNAGDGGTVILPRGARYFTNKPITIDRRVVVRGEGGRNLNSIKLTANANHMVYLSTNGITLQGITFDGNKKCGNVVHNFKKQDHKLLQLRVKNGNFACVGSPSGFPLAGLLIQGGEYENATFNIAILNRNNNNRVEFVKKTVIENASITQFANTGVQLDCANDDFNYVTDMNGHIVRNCTITGPGQFAVGCTLSKNLVYSNNTLTCKDDPIHIEYRSSNCNSKKNRLTTTERDAQGRAKFSCITMITGDTFVGANGGIRLAEKIRHENRVRDSFHVDNVLLGKSFFGIWGSESSNIRVLRNDHRGNTPRFEKIFLSTGDKNRQSFGGSRFSQGTRDWFVEGNIGVRKRDMFFATNRGHTINQPN